MGGLMNLQPAIDHPSFINLYTVSQSALDQPQPLSVVHGPMAFAKQGRLPRRWCHHGGGPMALDVCIAYYWCLFTITIIELTYWC